MSSKIMSDIKDDRGWYPNLWLVASAYMNLESPRIHTIGCFCEGISREAYLRKDNLSLVWALLSYGLEFLIKYKETGRKPLGTRIHLFLLPDCVHNVLVSCSSWWLSHHSQSTTIFSNCEPTLTFFFLKIWQAFSDNNGERN